MRPRPLVTALVLGAAVGSLLFPALGESLRRLSAARTGLGQGSRAARSRTFGAAYIAAIEKLKREIPLQDAYVLIDGSGGEDRHLFLRYDLSPRRALFLGRLVGERREFLSEGRPPDAPSTVVVARGGGAPPDVLTAEQFFDGMPVFDPGREDLKIPASLERPETGTDVRGALEVSGWCQETGGRPCADVRFFVDGREVPASVARHPRPDVERAVSGIGPANRAGFRASLPPPPESGEHGITAYFRTSDGRYRRLGPRVFTWRPE